MTPRHAGPPRTGRVWMWVIIALAVAGIALYLIIDHWTHLAAAAPYAGIIAIAAIHLFGHRGHGSHGGHGDPGHDHEQRHPRTADDTDPPPTDPA